MPSSADARRAKRARQLRRARRAYQAAADDDDSGSESGGDGAVLLQLVKPRTVFYRGSIEEPHASKFCIMLRELVRDDHDGGEIRVYLSSSGGDAYAGLAMHEHILELREQRPICVVADGYVASAATLVLVAASTRVMRDTATVLIHSVRTVMWGEMKPSEVQEEGTNLEQLMQIFRKVYRAHTRMTTRQLDDLLSSERNLNKAECTRLGIVDA